eukprot:5751721-Amphidinium_carterae.1
MREDLQKALHSCPSHVGARQMYLRGVMLKREEANHKRARAGGNPISQHSAMALHGHHCANLDEAEQTAYRRVAGIARSEAEHAKWESIRGLVAAIATQETKVAAVEPR